MLVLQRSRQSWGYCDMLEISGRTKILNQGFAVSWSSAHSITMVLKIHLISLPFITHILYHLPFTTMKLNL